MLLVRSNNRGMVHILVAEDNAGDVLLIRRALAQHVKAHKLHVFNDGEKAIEAVGSMGQPGRMPCPDLFLLDVNLPKADGLEVLREYRRLCPRCTDSPVIIVTSDREREPASYLGISHYFRKPYDLNAFMELEGCWEITGRVADAKLTFVTAVVRKR